MKKLNIFLVIMLLLSHTFMLSACGLFTGGFLWELTEDASGYTLKEYVGLKDDVKIPQTYREKPVTGIAEGAFDSKGSKVKSVIVPNSVTHIEKGAFSGCSALESISLPFIGASKEETVHTYFGYIFGGVSPSDNEDHLPSSLNTVIITGESSIDDYAFYQCANLTSIIISDSVTSIGAEAFDYCTDLIYEEYGNCLYINNWLIKAIHSSFTSVTLKDTTVGIADRAFMYSALLSEVTIPQSVKYIGKLAFKNCSALTEISMGDAVVSIGAGAFANSPNLTKINLPDGIKNLGEGALYDTNLDYEEYGNCLYINNWLIKAKDTSVTSVTLKDTTVVIYGDAFFNCKSLTGITLPAGVKIIGGHAFSYCTALEAVNISDLLAWCGITIDNYSANPLYYAKKLYLSGEEVTQLTIPPQITKIKPYAFYNCTSLTSLIIPSGVSGIGNEAFFGCSNIADIEVGDSVTDIGYAAFSQCASLTAVTMGKGVINIGENAFYGCTDLESVSLPSSLRKIGINSFADCKKLADVEIKEGVTSIERSAFRNCWALTNIVIPQSVIFMGDWAFANCKNLTSAVILGYVDHIGADVFEDCENITIFFYAQGSMPILGWKMSWNADKHPVYWAGQWHYDDDGLPVPNTP